MIHGLEPRLAEGGKIKIGNLGAKKVSQKTGKEFRVPVKLDHFILTKTARTTAGDLVVDAELTDALKRDGYADADGKIRRLPVVLHSDVLEEVFPSTYACYSGKRLACRGDGKTAEQLEIRDGQHTGETRKVACPCPLLNNKARGGAVCKPHGTLHCSIALPGHAVAGSVHRWRTTSIISIQQMMGSIAQIIQAVGVLRGVPLQLIVRPITVTPEGAGPTTVYVCHLELRAADLLGTQRALLEQAEMRRRISGGDAENQARYRALIAAPAADTEDDDEQAEVAEEFHPEAEDLGEPEVSADRETKTKALAGKLAGKRAKQTEAKQAEGPKAEGPKAEATKSADTKAAEQTAEADGPPAEEPEPPAVPAPELPSEERNKERNKRLSLAWTTARQAGMVDTEWPEFVRVNTGKSSYEELTAEDLDMIDGAVGAYLEMKEEGDGGGDGGSTKRKNDLGW